MTWRNRPTFTDNWPLDIPTMLFIDESGTSSLKKVSERISRGESPTENERFFSVVGCLVRREDASEIIEQTLMLKNRYWVNGLYKYGNREKRVCFHSSEMRRKEGPFSSSLIDNEALFNDLVEFIKVMPVQVFSSSIDKLKLVEKYTQPADPYSLCLSFIFERVFKYHLQPNEKCIVILEARGKKEDSCLHAEIKKLVDSGTPYANPSCFRCLGGVYFNPKWCSKEDDKKSYYGLEYADFFVYSIYKKFAYGKEDRLYNIIKKKIYGYPSIMGRGMKNFP